MRTGRPSALTVELIADVLRLLPVCRSIETAADFLGVSRSTFYRWLRRGAKEAARLAADPHAEPDARAAPFLDFWGAVKKGQAAAAVHALAAIWQAAGRDWRAAAWLLERRFPERFGRPRPRTADRQHRPAAGVVCITEGTT